MKTQFKYYPRDPMHSDPPPLYVAVDDVGEISIHLSRTSAEERLEALLEEYHESIASESGRHHHALDRRFYENVFVREI